MDIPPDFAMLTAPGEAADGGNMRLQTIGLGLAMVLALACGTPGVDARGPAPTPTGADPSVNAPFRDPKLDVKAWTTRFEGESREVWRAREQLIAAAGFTTGATVADIGTGSGLFIKYLADAVGPTGRVIATDISQPFLENAAKRAAEAGLANVTTVLATTHATGLAPASIDEAWICDVYHHFEDPAAMLADLRRALKAGGRLVIVDFHRIAGKSSDFIMKHVRADRETVIAEIVAAGFQQLESPPTPFLVENWFAIFERPGDVEHD